MNTVLRIDQQAKPKPRRKWLRVVKWFVATLLLIPVLVFSLSAIYFYLFVKDGNLLDKTEHKVKLEVLLDPRISNAEWKQKVRPWITFAADRLDEAANIRITLDQTQWLSLAPEDSGTYDLARIREFNARIQSTRQSSNTICLAYVYSDANAGTAFLKNSNIVCFYNERTKDRAKWVLLHELAHLFGAIHVAQLDSVMYGGRGDWRGDETRRFDEVNEEIMNLAREDVMARGATTFYLKEALPSHGERFVRLYRDVMREQREADKLQEKHQIAEYYAQNERYEEALAEWIDVYEGCLKAELIDQPVDLTDVFLLDRSSQFLTPTARSIGITLSRLGRHSEVLEYFLTALEREPKNTEYMRAVQAWYKQNRETEPALEVFESHADTAANSGVFWFFYGLTILKGTPVEVWTGERIERAKECLENAIEYQFEEGPCHLALAGILQQQGLQEDADAHLAKAKELGADGTLPFEKQGGGFRVAGK